MEDEKENLKFDNNNEIKERGADIPEEIRGEVPVAPETDPGIPSFTGKDLMAVFWVLVKATGGMSIDKAVLDQLAKMDNLKVERQWDAVNQTWRFFVPRKEAQKQVSKLILPKQKKLITLYN